MTRLLHVLQYLCSFNRSQHHMPLPSSVRPLSMNNSMVCYQERDTFSSAVLLPGVLNVFSAVFTLSWVLRMDGTMNQLIRTRQRDHDHWSDPCKLRQKKWCWLACILRAILYTHMGKGGRIHCITSSVGFLPSLDTIILLL